MVQGIMTGIGFLGAGTIMKQGLSVRGLTTAASIWVTAAIGVLVGIGFLFPALLASVLTLGTLSLFRWIESRMPSQFYAQLVVRSPATRRCPSRGCAACSARAASPSRTSATGSTARSTSSSTG
jgi:uncharacterized membrane protein YhiD involved in acid resistance